MPTKAQQRSFARSWMLMRVKDVRTVATNYAQSMYDAGYSRNELQSSVRAVHELDFAAAKLEQVIRALPTHGPVAADAAQKGGTHGR